MRKLCMMAFMLALVFCFSACASGAASTPTTASQASSSENSSVASVEETIDPKIRVQEGHLGTYSQAPVGRVLDVVAKNIGAEALWKNLEIDGLDDSVYIVEIIFVQEDQIVIQVQFMANYNDDTMEIVFFGKGNDENGLSDAYELKQTIDYMYSTYAELYPDDGIVVDDSLNNVSSKGILGEV